MNWKQWGLKLEQHKDFTGGSGRRPWEPLTEPSSERTTMTTDVGRIPDCPEHSWDQQAKGGVYLHHSTHRIDPQDNSHRHTTWLVCRTFRKMDLGENTQFQIRGFWSGTRGRKSLSPPRPQLLPLQPQRTGPARTDWHGQTDCGQGSAWRPALQGACREVGLLCCTLLGC